MTYWQMGYADGSEAGQIGFGHPEMPRNHDYMAGFRAGWKDETTPTYILVDEVQPR